MMNNYIVNDIFLKLILIFMVFMFITYFEISMLYILLFIFCYLFISLFHQKIIYKIKNKLSDIIDFPIVKPIILFLLLFGNSKNNIIDMTFINGGLLFMAIFYLLYDNEYIKYKLSENKLKNENITDSKQ